MWTFLEMYSLCSSNSLFQNIVEFLDSPLDSVVWPRTIANLLTHRTPVVWKLAQPQNTGPRYIRRWRMIYSYFTSNANRWAPGRMFSSTKYEHFVQVSSNQKHVFIMFVDVRCGQESISKQPWYILPAVMVVLPAVTHTFRIVRK